MLYLFESRDENALVSYWNRDVTSDSKNLRVHVRGWQCGSVAAVLRQQSPAGKSGNLRVRTWPGRTLFLGSRWIFPFLSSPCLFLGSTRKSLRVYPLCIALSQMPSCRHLRLFLHARIASCQHCRHKRAHIKSYAVPSLTTTGSPETTDTTISDLLRSPSLYCPLARIQEFTNPCCTLEAACVTLYAFHNARITDLFAYSA